MAATQTEGKITALYERLSRDDDIVGDSSSIANQKTYLEAYAAQQGFTNCVHYTDDGYSGVNFDRPGWNRMIDDMEAGKIGVVLVKDMSRIGRNYLSTGFYTEEVFRKLGVRFIAVSNGIDSNDPSTNEFAPIMNIMNEWYIRDLSRKQRTAIRVKGESGKPTSNQAIYGYKKDPDNKYHWLIDEEAAAVVHRIFQLTIEGHGPYEIARILYDDKVEAPAVYLARQNRGVWKSKEEFRSPYFWAGNVVGQILAKPEYMGDTVNFRSHKASYKDKRAVMNPQDEWLIFENTHEAIIDRETWELAQKLRKTPRRIDHIEEANPFTGLLYCAECGAKLYNHRTRAGSKGKPYPTDFFDCSTYTLATQRHEKGCCSHTITTKAVRKMTLDAIRHVSTYAIANQEEFLNKVHAASQLRQEEAAKQAKRQLNKDRKRIAELDNIIKKLYESYAIGRITDERFDSLMAEYESEQKSLKAAVAAAEQNLAVFAEDSARADSFLEVAKRYTDYSELTTQMLNEFIDKIVIHKPEKIDGDRVMEVDFYFRFIGNFELPPRELTPEEIAEAARLKKERQRSRKRYQRIKSGEIVPGQKKHYVCKMCGKACESHVRSAMFCSANCRQKFYRKEAREERERIKREKAERKALEKAAKKEKPLYQYACECCGKLCTAKLPYARFCGGACQQKAYYHRMKAERAAKRTAGDALITAEAASVPTVADERPSAAIIHDQPNTAVEPA